MKSFFIVGERPKVFFDQALINARALRKSFIYIPYKYIHRSDKVDDNARFGREKGKIYRWKYAR